jgi:hypothetical protein
MPRESNIHFLHRAKPRLIRPLTEREVEYLRDYVEPVRLKVEAKRAKPTDLSDFALGAAAGFFVGLAPFLAMLAFLVFAS